MGRKLLTNESLTSGPPIESIIAAITHSENEKSSFTYTGNFCFTQLVAPYTKLKTF